MTTTMDLKYKNLREKLYDLGYKQPLVPEAACLVEKLLNDLLKTTESLQKYVNIAKKAVEERDILQLGAEPYRCDNAKLVKECNDLHLALIHCKESNAENIRAKRKEICKLEKEKHNLGICCEKYKRYCSELEEQLKRKPPRTAASARKLNLKAQNTQLDHNKPRCKIQFEEVSKMCDERVHDLLEEINQLKEERLEYAEMIQCYRHQVKCREKEIERLQCMLEGGRPIDALVKDCCYKDAELQLNKLQQELYELKKEKIDLEEHLRESVVKQHEAMKRALCLVDRNKQLEKELDDIDQMALTVEAECNSTLRNSVEKINRLQAKMHEITMQNQRFEKEIDELRREKQHMTAELDCLRNERRNLQSELTDALQEKQHLLEKVHEFERIEQDLNMEIDRLVQMSASQKRRLTDMDGSISINSRSHRQSMECNDLLSKQLEEKDAEIIKLREENQVCMQKMHAFKQKSDLDVDSTKSVLKKLEREKEMLGSDIRKLEEDKSSLERCLQDMGEKHRSTELRLKDELCRAEETIKKLEEERRDLLSADCVKRSSVNSLEQHIRQLTDELYQAQSELNEQKTMYHQVKVLHEQSDKTLNDAQEKIAHLQAQLADAHEKNKTIESHKRRLTDEVSSLRAEINSTRNSLEIMDREKDELLIKLDNKTEKCSMLEDELCNKNEKLSCLEGKCADFQKKISTVHDDTASREFQLRSVTRELETLKNQLDDAIKEKEAAARENCCLRGEIVAARAECRKNSGDMDYAQRQINELKNQLQEYVKEVKKYEDALAKKELERNELLEQFKCLSKEASLLESNNQCLEESANNSKIQLSATLDHVATLERKLEGQEAMICCYEKQIKEMNQELANMEMIITEQRRERECLEMELEKCRQCTNHLDRQKEEIMAQMHSKKSEHAQLYHELEKLKEENKLLQKKIDREKAASERVECLLSENRKEAVELRLANQELCSEIDKLKKTIEDLQDKIVRLEDHLEILELSPERSEINKRHLGDGDRRYPSL